MAYFLKEMGSLRIIGWRTPQIQHPFMVSALQSSTYTTPPSNTGVDQPGNEEMISLSAATVRAPAVMTHGCVLPARRERYNGFPVRLQESISYVNMNTASFLGKDASQLRGERRDNRMGDAHLDHKF